jgi:predicted dehydrogenase
MAPLRLAVIGAGGIGARHVELVSAEASCRLVALADPASASVDLARKAGVAHYADYEELLERERPEAAIVAVPTALHTPVGVACAQRGVHVLMEKPIAESVAAGRELLAAVERADVRLVVGHLRRFDPAVEAAREIIDSGEIGRLVAVAATWCLRKPEAYYEAAWRREPGGGPVMINLIHDIDSLRAICGEIDKIYAETSSAVRGFPVEDTAAIILRFANGALGTVTVSDSAPSPWGWEQATGENPIIPASQENCYRFMGTEGALDFPSLTLWHHEGSEPGDWTRPIVSASRSLGERASLVKQLRHFCRVARGEEAPRISGADGLATLAATLAVLESARLGAPVVPES